MSGVERLRELGNDYAEHSWSEAGKSRGMLMLNIADQIERERERDADTIENVRLIVGGVIDDMERHVLGHEGMEDSPVARWARELREALGGDERDHAADVSVSAYDLLPKEDREAIAWVREHGGLDYVKSEWRSRVPYDRYERRRQRLLGHIAECERALGRRNQRIEELERSLSEAVSAQLASDAALYDLRREVRGQCQAFGVDVSGCEIASEMLHDMNEALSFRLMPEGCEWPRYESGEPVGFGDEVSRLGEVFSISLYCDGSFALNFSAYSKGERVRRPAKVLDADGVEIRVGDTVWHIRTGDEYSVIGVPSESVINVSRQLDGRDIHGVVSPYSLTHRAPVLAADGRPLREGEHVYHVETGAELVVKKLPKPGEYQAVIVFALPTSPASHLTSFDPDQLTHERPVADTWERLEEDAAKNPFDYCKDVGHRLDTCENSEAYKARDLVRRAKALAGDA